MTTREIIDRIFKEPGTSYELTEFESLGRPIHEILEIHPKTATAGRDAGKTKYFLKSLIPFSSGNEEVQVYVEGGKSAPEEIVRQLWVYKLIHQYGYHADEIDLEKSVQFGTQVGTKAADIIVYENATKTTPKIIVECKKPKRKDGIEQLKSYMNAKGAPVAIWSNGSDSIILYRPYPAQFDDTLFDLPKRGQKPKDVLEARKTLLQLKKDFNFKRILQDLEELVLADSGKDEFNEIFKLIFAKIWDEKEALENRAEKVVEFRKAIDPDITFDRINTLFHRACEEWPGIFRENEDIELARRHLQVCVGPIEGVRLMGSNLRIMDDAFEYLLPTEAKKKKGQFFTPRHVVEMCVRMLNPKRNESNPTPTPRQQRDLGLESDLEGVKEKFDTETAVVRDQLAHDKPAHGDRLTHETQLFQRLWDVLVAGDVLLADRGFFSFSAFAGILAKGRLRTRCRPRALLLQRMPGHCATICQRRNRCRGQTPHGSRNY